MSHLDVDGLIRRREDEESSELAADLVATWEPSSPEASAAAWLSRPSILRRIADAMSQRLRGDVDRLVAIGPGSVALAAAVSLSAGIPFQAETPDGRYGELLPGEAVCLLSVTDDGPDPELADAAPGARIVQRMSIVSSPRGEEDGSRSALFTRSGRGLAPSTERNRS